MTHETRTRMAAVSPQIVNSSPAPAPPPPALLCGSSSASRPSAVYRKKWTRYGSPSHSWSSCRWLPGCTRGGAYQGKAGGFTQVYRDRKGLQVGVPEDVQPAGQPQPPVVLLQVGQRLGRGVAAQRLQLGVPSQGRGAVGGYTKTGKGCRGVYQVRALNTE